MHSMLRTLFCLTFFGASIHLSAAESTFMRAVLFSPVELQLIRNDLPVVGVEVRREVSWRGAIVEKAITDTEGVVTFDALRRFSFTSFLPMELVVPQYISAVIDGKELELWLNTKRDGALNAELGGMPLKLRCNLSDELSLYEAYGSLLSSRCHW